MSLQLKKLYGDSIAFVSPQNVIHTDIADKLKAKVIGKRKGHAWEQIDLLYYENDEPNKEFAEDNIDSCAAHNFSSDLQNSSSLELKAEEAVKIVHGRYY